MKKYVVVYKETSQTSYGEYWVVWEFDNEKDALSWVNTQESYKISDLSIFRKLSTKLYKVEVMRYE